MVNQDEPVKVVVPEEVKVTDKINNFGRGSVTQSLRQIDRSSLYDTIL